MKEPRWWGPAVGPARKEKMRVHTPKARVPHKSARTLPNQRLCLRQLAFSINELVFMAVTVSNVWPIYRLGQIWTAAAI
jgi:hypothetical protein